jgi:hypothetical protein
MALVVTGYRLTNDTESVCRLIRFWLQMESVRELISKDDKAYQLGATDNVVPRRNAANVP